MNGELNPRFTFDTFVTGPSNRLAVTAARSAAETPGGGHNPLFVYGQTGLGKTHLAMAIGQAARQYWPEMQVEYMTLDEFVEAFHSAVSLGQIESFRQRYRQTGVIIIDDVHFLAHRHEEQEELLRFATEVQEGGTQIILTSDRPPDEIADLDDRLISRLAGGLVVDIAAPEYETRLAILRRRAEERGVELSREALTVVADYDVRNVRELIGVLNRIIAFQAVSENALTPDAVRALLEGGEATVSVAPPPSAAASGNEFDDFLSGVAATLTEQVEVWKAHIRKAVQQWSSRGYRTASLEVLLEQDAAVDTDAAVRKFQNAVDQLHMLESEIADLDPPLARNPVFRDPERVSEANALVQSTREAFVAPPGPSDAFSLDDFLVGESSKVAVTAARSVTEAPGAHYNPLVIVGPSGVGKTHLLHGLGHALAGQPEGRWVACISAQTFMDELVRAIEEDAVPVWRARYRQASAFLLDNIDLIGSGERLQEEIFNLFNALSGMNRQIVLTASVPPKDIAGLDDRLRSRFEGGLIATLDPPDLGLRSAILGRQLGARVDDVDLDVVEFLAGQRAESVRSVLGMGQRVITAAEAKGVKPTVELAREVLGASNAREARASERRRTSGVVISPAGGVESGEKMVLTWPDAHGYLIEEFE